MKILAEGPDGKISALLPHGFNLEARLQELLEHHPELALADSPEGEETRIWTIGREVATPSGSIDLLLLDSSARVWVVETKLARNPEVKKQVVGQVLGYASCAAEWTRADLERIGSAYLGTGPDGASRPATLTDFLVAQLGDEEAASQLLDQATEAVSNGELTALIVVDDIPKELQRLVEFVNRHAEFELLALKIEVTEYAGARLFVPAVVGQIVAGGGGGRETGYWDEDRFFRVLEANAPAATAPARFILDWVSAEPRLQVWYGRGAKIGSIVIWTAVGEGAGDWAHLFNMSTNGLLGGGWVWRGAHKEAPWWAPFPAELQSISGVPQAMDKAQGFSMAALARPASMSRFQQAVVSLLDRIAAASSA